MAENQIFTRKDGARIWVDSVTAPMVEAGEVVGAVQVLRDVSERRVVERMKDEFVSMVSHELRTPLTAVRGALGLLTKGAVKAQPDRAQRLLELATINADRLAHLISDILDSARLESGGSSLVRKLQTHGPGGRPDAPDGGGGRRGDHEAADAFNPGGPRRPAAGAHQPAEQRHQVLTAGLGRARGGRPGWRLCCVSRDRSRTGIPPDKLKTVFGRFQAVDASGTRQRGGTGLGLFICKGTVQRHGGQISAESKPGSGSTFVVTLPLKG